MTRLCADAVAKLGEAFEKAWQGVEAESRAAGLDPTLENVLSRAQMKITALGPGDKLCGLDGEGWVEFDRMMRRTIASTARPSDSLIPGQLPHDILARWVARTARNQPIEIFTVNYDVLLERSLEAERIPVFDGFVGSYEPFFHPESLTREQFAPGACWTRLWKLHGSINWQWQERGGQRRITRGLADDSGELILPSYQKYDESRKQPYVTLMERLTRFLDRDDAFLVTVGFSFGDQHINAVVFDALAARPRTHVCCLQYDEVPDSHDLVRRAKQRLNLAVLGPATAVMSGVKGTWRLGEPVDDRAADLIDVGFDSDAVPPDVSEPGAVSGRFRLGDFTRFCAFLGSMVQGVIR